MLKHLTVSLETPKCSKTLDLSRFRKRDAIVQKRFIGTLPAEIVNIRP